MCIWDEDVSSCDQERDMITEQTRRGGDRGRDGEGDGTKRDGPQPQRSYTAVHQRVK